VSRDAHLFHDQGGREEKKRPQKRHLPQLRDALHLSFGFRSLIKACTIPTPDLLNWQIKPLSPRKKTHSHDNEIRYGSCAVVVSCITVCPFASLVMQRASPSCFLSFSQISGIFFACAWARSLIPVLLGFGRFLALAPRTESLFGRCVATSVGHNRMDATIDSYHGAIDGMSVLDSRHNATR